jgi:uncharacterized protein (DUF362 family)
MGELHASPDQRRMIAEINAAYTPSLIVVDGVEAFRSGGPDTGDKVLANVVLAGSDRVAIDAVGVAILRLLGTTPEVSAGPIFAQEQLARRRVGAGRQQRAGNRTGHGRRRERRLCSAGCGTAAGRMMGRDEYVAFSPYLPQNLLSCL